MNERIRELIKQAGGEFWQRLENDTVNPEAYITFDPPESLEKFVELIVKECATICNKIYFNNYPDAEDFERSEEGDAIKKHFGVKE